MEGYQRVAAVGQEACLNGFCRAGNKTLAVVEVITTQRGGIFVLARCFNGGDVNRVNLVVINTRSRNGYTFGLVRNCLKSFFLEGDFAVRDCEVGGNGAGNIIEYSRAAQRNFRSFSVVSQVAAAYRDALLNSSTTESCTCAAEYTGGSKLARGYVFYSSPFALSQAVGIAVVRRDGEGFTAVALQS